jgi:hypothetical protein
MEDKVTEVDPVILTYLSDVNITTMSDRLAGNLHHYEITSNLTSERGTGYDFEKEVAFQKAQSELVERLVLLLVKLKDKSFKTSNGFAAHTTISKAKESAYKELIERDLFLTSWFSGHYPSWNLDEFLSLDFNLLNTEISLFESHQLGLKVGYIGKTEDIFCLTAVIYDLKERFGGLFVAAADYDANIALKKLLMDVRRMGTYILNSITSNRPLYSDNNLLFKAIDHQNYYLNIRRLSFIKNYINNHGEPIKLSPIHKFYTVFNLPKEISSTMSAVHCNSSDAQNYFIGRDLSQNINISRIKEVGGLDLSRRVHPFG